jgi:hypothetical protein
MSIVNVHRQGRVIVVDDLDAHARALIEANLYLTLGTADAEGRPWVSPVYFATADYTEFYWVSAHDAAHSRNIAQRPQVSMVICDSQVPTYHGRAVYLSAMAAELAGRDLDRGIGIYPGPVTRGATTMAPDDVTAPSPYRHRGIRPLPARTPATVPAALDQRRPPNARPPMAERPLVLWPHRFAGSWRLDCR